MKQLIAKMNAKVMLALMALTATSTAMASEGGTAGGTALAEEAFDDFEATLLSWVNGPLGVGLAVTALVMGGGLGLIKASPLPAIAGVALAAFFAFAPGAIISLVTSGAML